MDACDTEYSRGTSDPYLIGVVVIPMYRPGLGPRAYSLVMARREKDDPTCAVGAAGTAFMLVREIALEQAGLS